MGKVLIVTGDLGGIGAVIWARTASQGYSVGVNYAASKEHTEEIATAALWICSDQASSVTGTMLDISGSR